MGRERNEGKIWIGEVLTDSVPAGADGGQREVLEWMLRLGVGYKVVECGDAVSIEDCEGVGQVLGARLVKTLFVCNRQKTRFHLVSMPGEKVFVTRQFTRGRGVSRVSFVSAEGLWSMLRTPVGGAGPLSLVNDGEKMVEMVIDRELADDDFVALPVLSPHMYVGVRMGDVRDVLLPAMGHSSVDIEMVAQEGEENQ